MGKRRATTEGTEGREGKVPALRFPYYMDRWLIRKNSDLLERISNPVNVSRNQLYVQIGIRSHGKGIFHKEPVTGKKLGNKRVFWLYSNLLVFNIVFAWEQAVALTTGSEEGLIASHRFPMYRAYSGISNAQYLLHFYLTPKGKHLLGLASPGGAGRNKTLGQKEFDNLRFFVPCAEEQARIAAFLSAADRRIALLERKREALERYKKGVMQRLFTVEASSSTKGNGRCRPALRFKDDRGREFPDWEEKRLGEVLTIGSGKDYKHLQDGNIPVFGTGGYMTSVNDYLYDGETVCIGRKGTIDKPLFHVGKLWTVDTLFYTHSYVNVIPRFLYYIFTRINWIKFNEASGVPSLSKITIEKIPAFIPSLPEQQKIAAFLSALDRAIEKLGQQIEASKEWKRGLLQKMFV